MNTKLIVPPTDQFLTVPEVIGRFVTFNLLDLGVSHGHKYALTYSPLSGLLALVSTAEEALAVHTGQEMLVHTEPHILHTRTYGVLANHPERPDPASVPFIEVRYLPHPTLLDDPTHMPLQHALWLTLDSHYSACQGALREYGSATGRAKPTRVHVMEREWLAYNTMLDHPSIKRLLKKRPYKRLPFPLNALPPQHMEPARLRYLTEHSPLYADQLQRRTAEGQLPLAEILKRYEHYHEWSRAVPRKLHPK
jgi:hypothetical protein